MDQISMQNTSFASTEDHAACRAMIRTGSKSFFAASLILPPHVRQAAYALYGFCRLSDDMVDEHGGASDAIARLRARLDRAYAGRPGASSIDRAFADVIADYGLPRALPEALIDGLEWDVAGVDCETPADVCAYGARVAGSVGAMMTVLMGVRDADVVARACDLGVAMQLTNIARDVGEDARNGRLYLPRAWLRAEGLDPDAWRAAPAWTPEIGRVVARLLALADQLYRRAETGIGGLPAACRPGIFAARHLYAAIGGEVENNGFNSIAVRARVSFGRKLCLMGLALWDAARPRAVEAAPPLAETRFLVDAVTQGQALEPRGAAPPRRITERVLWVAELFASLRERERMLQTRT
jgi:phytoene synthase